MPMLDVARRSAGLLRRLQSRYLPTRLDRIKAVHEWTREVQLRYLIRQVRALPDRALVVELGVWQGRSVLALAGACRARGTRVVAIDPCADLHESRSPV